MGTSHGGGILLSLAVHLVLLLSSSLHLSHGFRKWLVYLDSANTVGCWRYVHIRTDAWRGHRPIDILYHIMIPIQLVVITLIRPHRHAWVAVIIDQIVVTRRQAH